MKSFLSQLISWLDIDSGSTRVGLVTFSTRVGTSISLSTYSSRASHKSVLSTLRLSGGTTNTAAALEYVRTTALTSAAGDRSDVRNVVVLLTAASDDPTSTQVSTVSESVTCIVF